MRAISIINLKGGVGKTVTTINLAAILAQDHHKRVLVIDADSQHNTTDFFGVGDPDNNLSALLRGEADSYWENIVSHTDIEGVDILPGDDGLMTLDVSQIREGRINGAVLRDFLLCLAEDDAYDYVLFDCPPAFNAASSAALYASTYAIIPIKLDRFSLAGLSNMILQIHNMHQINPGLRIAGCLITMWSKSCADAEAQLRKLDKLALPTFKQVIRRSDRVDASTFEGEPLTAFSPRSSAGIDYRAWCKEFLEEVGDRG